MYVRQHGSTREAETCIVRYGNPLSFRHGEDVKSHPTRHIWTRYARYYTKSKEGYALSAICHRNRWLLTTIMKRDIYEGYFARNAILA
jgi:hypothetical protein